MENERLGGRRNDDGTRPDPDDMIDGVARSQRNMPRSDMNLHTPADSTNDESSRTKTTVIDQENSNPEVASPTGAPEPQSPPAGPEPANMEPQSPPASTSSAVEESSSSLEYGIPNMRVR